MAGCAVTVEASVRVRRDAFTLDVELTAAADETVAVLGPNGAGKTTLLRALAGLDEMEGRVVLDGEVLEDSARGVYVPAERRRAGLVFQDHVLFPHLSAVENVAFGLRAQGRPHAAAIARRWLSEAGLADRADALPRALSGGQAQRVALLRALATEAMALADKLVVLEHGSVVQSGTPDDVTARPRSRFVADLAGVNLLRGRAYGDHVALPSEASLAAVDAGSGDVFAVVHPRAVALYRSRPDGTPRNVWRGQVDTVDLEGERVRVPVVGPVPLVAEVTRAAVLELGLIAGASVWMAVKATEVSVYPA